MIKIKNTKFAETEEEFINSLFESDGTCSGYAKRTKRTIKLKDHNYKLVGVINGGGVFCCATELKPGQYWYSYADINMLGQLSYSESHDIVEGLSTKSIHINGVRQYSFK